MFFSELAVAQNLPLFGTAMFGEAAFSMAEPSVPVPFMPLWATVALAVSLWVVAVIGETAHEGKGRRRYGTSTRSFVLQDSSTLVGKSNPTSDRLKQRYPHVSEGISRV